MRRAANMTNRELTGKARAILPITLLLLLLPGCLRNEAAGNEPPVAGHPPPTTPMLFSDGAENGTSAWRLASNTVLIDFTGNTPPQELDQPHPNGSWQASTAQFHNGSKSWFSQYPDNYRARMEATVEIPAIGANLKFWYKGGAENNSFDGLHLFIAGTQVAYFSGVPVEWTLATYALPKGMVTVEFRFESDPFCSNVSPPRPPGDPSEMACIEGWDAGGYYLDDITIE